VNITFRPIDVAVHPQRLDGLLVLSDGALCAVLTRLDDDVDPPGGWFVEAAFGPLHGRHPSFVELAQVATWVRLMLAGFLKPAG
jgi:hypothetical protein